MLHFQMGKFSSTPVWLPGLTSGLRPEPFPAAPVAPLDCGPTRQGAGTPGAALAPSPHAKHRWNSAEQERVTTSREPRLHHKGPRKPAPASPGP